MKQLRQYSYQKPGRFRKVTSLAATEQSMKFSETPWQQTKHRHVISTEQFNKKSLEIIMQEAQSMCDLVQSGARVNDLLQGKIMATLFYEPSTRTRLSFESAMLKLGGQFINTENAREFSSSAKGESIEDTIRTVEGYADVIVLRHHLEGSAATAARVASVPIINAGDGAGQHPTQALLDVFTIRRELGRFDNFKLALVGDLKHGRTTHSLAQLAASGDNVELFLAAPPNVSMRQDILDWLTVHGVKYTVIDSLDGDWISDMDVIYMTRVQRERFGSEIEYQQAKGQLMINPQVMNRCKNNAVLLHPLPRVDEISVEVDSDARAAYFRQCHYGVQVRMALLKLCLLNQAPPGISI